MKILITTDWYAPVINGVVTSVTQLQKELEKRGHEVRILTLSADGVRARKDGVYYIKSFDIGRIYPQARGTVHFIDPFVEELIMWGPDVIHSQCELVSFPFAKRIQARCQCPIIHTYHTVYEDYTHYFTKHEQAGRKFVRLSSRFILEHVDAVIAPTQKVTKLLQGYGVRNYIDTVATGVDLDRFAVRISAEEKRLLKRQIGIAEDKKVLAYIGRLAQEKDVQTLITYMDRMRNTHPELVLMITGDGPYREALEAQVSQLNLAEQVIFTGMAAPEEVYKYYQLGDLFVCASGSETQGLTFIEALASGLPLLCRRDECLAEVVQDGYNGYQFTRFDEFERCLNSFFGNDQLRCDMQIQARRSAEVYAAGRFGERICAIYQREVNRRNETTQVTVFRMLMQKLATM